MNEYDESWKIRGKERREKRRRERRKKKVKKLLISLAVFLVLAGIYYTVFYTDFFLLEDINVEGNIVLEGEEIIGDSGLMKGDNLLFINKDELVESINQMPYIKETRVKKRYPDGMDILVVERTGEILLKSADQVILLDFEGVPLETVDAMGENHMIVETDNTYECHMGNGIVFGESNISFDLIVDLMYYISLNDMVYVNKLRISGDSVYAFVDSGTLVKLDQSKDMKYQIVFSKNIIDERTDKNQDVNGLIDYTKGENPVYISSEDSEVRFEE